MKSLTRRTIWVVVASLIVLGNSPGAGEHEFVGSSKCKMCHLKEWKSWSRTRMAKAFDLLQPGARPDARQAAGLEPDKDYTRDETCVRCHVTGWGQPGGFVDIETTPDLAGVGCEVCHGPGGTYLESQYMSLKNKEYKKAELVQVGLVDVVAEEQCRGCHNTDSPFVGPDYVFDFELRKMSGTHDKHPLKYEH